MKREERKVKSYRTKVKATLSCDFSFGSPCPIEPTTTTLAVPEDSILAYLAFRPLRHYPLASSATGSGKIH